MISSKPFWTGSITLSLAAHFVLLIFFLPTIKTDHSIAGSLGQPGHSGQLSIQLASLSEISAVEKTDNASEQQSKIETEEKQNTTETETETENTQNVAEKLAQQSPISIQSTELPVNNSKALTKSTTNVIINPNEHIDSPSTKQLLKTNVSNKNIRKTPPKKVKKTTPETKVSETISTKISTDSPTKKTNKQENEMVSATPTNLGGQSSGRGISARAQAGGAAKESYAAKVRAWLIRHKRYPKKARRKRLEGLGKIYFKLNSSGEILNFKLRKSTGSKILDREIIAMLKRATPLPAFPDSLNAVQQEFTIPVSFAIHR